MLVKISKLDSVFGWLSYLSVVIIGVVFLIDALANLPKTVEAYVSPVDAKFDTTQRFTSAVVLGPGKLHILQPTTKMQYFAPDLVFDLGYIILFLLSGILLLIFFREFTYRNPFTKKALWGIRALFGLLLGFMIANLYRLDWFANQISEVTSGQYIFERPGLLHLPEFWILVVLLRLLRMFSQGLSLQKESQLTI